MTTGTPDSPVTTTADGPVLTITLDQPPVNAIDDPMVAALHRALDEAEAQSPTVVVIRSATRAFSAGADLAFIRSCFGSDEGIGRMVAYVESLHVLFDRLETFPAVTLAVIEGAALGGGLELALACDLRLASAAATVGLPEARVGMIPGAGGTQRLTRLCGPGVSSRLILGGEMVDGAEAHRLGIVQWVAEPADVEEAARGIGERIADLSRPALLASKSCIAAWSDPAVDGYRWELEQPAHLMRTAEAQQRITDFFASRGGATGKE